MERLQYIGHLSPVSPSPCSRLGIGLEKLDRDVYDPRPVFDPLKNLGIKFVRIQSGWQRTETEKGIYHFQWLDEIVDALCSRGMEPWICLCYGNPLYSPEAEQYFGAVGVAPTQTEEEKNAWKNYVTALVTRYTGRVTWYEVWNEPDGQWCWKKGPDAAEYAHFANDTADCIHAADPGARVMAGALCRVNLPYFARMCEEGVCEHADALSFHRYNADEFSALRELNALRALADRYRPGIALIQGESGTQSRSGGAGALKEGAWTEEKQAKYLLRHRLIDLSSELLFTSHFTAVDMVEALNGTAGAPATWQDWGYFGVLQMRPDGTCAPKKSYRALQSLCALFPGDEKPAALPVLQESFPSPRVLGTDEKADQMVFLGFSRPNGAQALAYWKSCDLMRETFDGTLSLLLAREKRTLRLIDPMNGDVYALPEEMTLRDPDGSVIALRHLPLTDSPLILTFGDFAVL